MSQKDIFHYKSYLFTIAYNMLGDDAAAEDLVQDTFVKWLESDTTHVKEMRSYLSRIIINKAIDRLEQAKREREKYKGLWMPVPIMSDSPSIEEDYTIEYALLFLLEKLNPYERAVFVLKEVFSYSYEEISKFLEQSQDNCRQLLHRAKEKVRAPKKRQAAENDQHRELLEAFLMAYHQNEFKKLEEIFRKDIVLYSDGGGKMAAALKPIHGMDKVIKFLVGVAGLDPEARFALKPIYMNAGEATLIFRNSVLDTALYIVVEENKITELYFLRNPDKIKIKNL